MRPGTDPRPGRRRVLAVPLLTLALAGCRSSGGGEGPPSGDDPTTGRPGTGADLPVDSPEPMTHSTLRSGTHSGLPYALFTAVRDAEHWRALWSRHAGDTLPAEELPPVDFEADTVLAVVLGSRPSAGYGVAVEEVTVEGGVLVVTARESSPSPDSMQASVLTTPFVFVRVDRFDGPVEFRVRD